MSRMSHMPQYGVNVGYVSEGLLYLIRKLF